MLIPSAVVIHFPQTDSVKQHLNHMCLEYIINDYEYDVLVDKIPYECLDGTYQDPDEQLCDHYGFNYDLVNCIEAVY